jgi:3-methyladenine DNA glycosylase AlkD
MKVDRMITRDGVLRRLKAKANPGNLEGMARFGITPEKRLGVSMPDIRRIAKESGSDHAVALELWETGIPDARIAASLMAVPGELTEKQMEAWAGGFNSWDVCDQVCMNLFRKSPLAFKKISDWSKRDGEFVKRAAFALIACLACHDRERGDEKFVKLLGIIRRGASDERNYVRKAVSWALRNIGKRNRCLNKAAIRTALDIRRSGTKAARWIASDAVRELESEAVMERLARGAG